MKIRVDTLLAKSPAQIFFQRKAAQQLVVLAYHGINDPVQFEQHLAYLAGEMQPISAEMLRSALNGKASLPERAVFVTFDDGEVSVYAEGLPLLRQYGVPGALFVVPGLLDSNTPFWWTEVTALVTAGATTREVTFSDAESLVRLLKKIPDAQRRNIIQELRTTTPEPLPAMPQLRRQDLIQLEAAGIAIGNHTWSHPCLNMCSDDVVHAEISQAHDTLTEILGHHPLLFAYPNGDMTESAEKALTDLGYEAAFLFDHQLNHLPVNNRLQISRVRVNANTPIDRFKTIVSGLHPALHHLRGKR
jgi:peptidoglycan/xylan/chitin deacetylase (PgdA/CDA1 family)